MTQAGLNQVYTGRAMKFEGRYAVQIKFLVLCTLFSAGVPLLNVLCLAVFACQYAIDKFLFSKFYAIPQTLTNQLALLFSSFVPSAVFLRTCVAIWMWTNPDIVANDVAGVGAMATTAPGANATAAAGYAFFDDTVSERTKRRSSLGPAWHERWARDEEEGRRSLQSPTALFSSPRTVPWPRVRRAPRARGARPAAARRRTVPGRRRRRPRRLAATSSSYPRSRRGPRRRRATRPSAGPSSRPSTTPRPRTRSATTRAASRSSKRSGARGVERRQRRRQALSVELSGAGTHR